MPTLIEPGNLFIISAPSGAGKTSLVKALIESIPGLTVSISHTTRGQRPGETHGLNYYFTAKEEFHRMVEHHEFLEHAQVFGYCYGTSKKWVQETLANGLDVILEIDWQGSQQIRSLFPKCISVFILPPSVKDLYERLTKRNQDNAEIIKNRMSDVHESTRHTKEYDYIIVNDDFDTALNDLATIVRAKRLVKERQLVKFKRLLEELANA
jgi:guanylate kinase